eukprot:1616769-Amphidinium_carterae.1
MAKERVASQNLLVDLYPLNPLSVTQSDMLQRMNKTTTDAMFQTRLTKEPKYGNGDCTNHAFAKPRSKI